MEALRDRRTKVTEDTIAELPVRDHRRERLFAPGQPLKTSRHYRNLISACDTEIKQHLETFESNVDPPEASTSVSSEASSNPLTHYGTRTIFPKAPGN